MIAAKTRARSAPRLHRMLDPRREAHELRIRVVGHDPRIGNHLQLTASALAMEARRTDDLRLARILLNASTRIMAVARALDALQALDLGNRAEVARRAPEVVNELRACLWADAAEAETVNEERALRLAAGELVAAAVREGAHAKGACVRLEQGGSGRRLDVLPAPGKRDNAGLRMLRAFAARFGASPHAAPLPHGASISVLIE